MTKSLKITLGRARLTEKGEKTHTGQYFFEGDFHMLHYIQKGNVR